MLGSIGRLLAPRAGFEPATIRLTVECSTTELPGNVRKVVRRPQRITKPFRLGKHKFNGPGMPLKCSEISGKCCFAGRRRGAVRPGERRRRGPVAKGCNEESPNRRIQGRY